MSNHERASPPPEKRTKMSETTPTLSLVEMVLTLQEQHQANSTRAHSKTHGQFFTPSSVASFMAGLLRVPKRTFRVLDPGAGTGILSAAVCDQVARLKSPRFVHLELYETEQSVLPMLRECLERCEREMRRAGHRLTFELHEADFIFSASPQASLFASQQKGAFDAVIMNPPYFKIGKDSAYARAMANVVHGQPNIYSLFMALAADLLKADGQLVAITPRSFCNGLYFRGFRRWFFEKMSLDHVHLFESRTDTFRHAKVLQESVVTLSSRAAQGEIVDLTTSEGQVLAKKLRTRTLRADHVLDDTSGDIVVRIPEDPSDSEVIAFVESWPNRFRDMGLRVSTGPVVAFRARSYLRAEMNGRTVPFLSVHNVRAFETRWPVDKGGKPTAFFVAHDSESLLLPAKNYVLLRRFTAKEEKRRLVASCFFRRDSIRPRVALENHLNYVYHGERELSEDECMGLSALFNSALLDRYFRAISGSTQVNATELRAMPLPPLGVIARIGKKLLRRTELPRADIERAVLSELNVGKPLTEYLEEHVN